MKKILSIFLVVVIALSVVGIVLAKDNFADAGTVVSDGTPPAPPSDWAKESVDKAKSLNIIKDDVVYP